MITTKIILKHNGAPHYLSLILFVLLETESLTIYPTEGNLKLLLVTQRAVISSLEHATDAKRRAFLFIENRPLLDIGLPKGSPQRPVTVLHASGFFHLHLAGLKTTLYALYAGTRSPFQNISATTAIGSSNIELEKFEKEHLKVTTGKQTNLENAVHSFALVNRLALDFNSIQKTIHEKPGAIRNKALIYSDEDDLEAMVRGLPRLQRFYLLNITLLAQGVLNASFSESGKEYIEFFLPMTASDCFRISEVLFKINEQKLQLYKKGIPWLLESLRILEKEQNHYELKKHNILKAICEAYLKLEDIKNYLKWAKKLKVLQPGNSKLENDMRFYEGKLNTRRPNQTTKKKKKRKVSINLLTETTNCISSIETKLFRQHCRGEVNVPHEISKRLKCWYFTGYHPLLRLAPIKAEQLYIKPDIFIYHDILNDLEMQKMINVTERKLVPDLVSAVNKNRTRSDVMERLSFRQCASAAVPSTEMAAVNRRLSHLTGLPANSTITTVTYYGVAGHFATHTDVLKGGIMNECKENIKRRYHLTEEDATAIKDALANHLYRVETIVMYLSDVEQGGATVFPLLGLTVFPKKGSALVFTNSFPFSKEDLTCHAACSVLRGSKWMASLWINHDSQEVLNRPCLEEIFSRSIKQTPLPLFK